MTSDRADIERALATYYAKASRAERVRVGTVLSLLAIAVAVIRGGNLAGLVASVGFLSFFTAEITADRNAGDAYAKALELLNVEQAKLVEAFVAGMEKAQPQSAA